MKKAAFVNQRCDIWHQGLSPKNVKAGFQATGIFPVDSTKFPKHHLDRRLVKRYELWVSLGKPENLLQELAHSVTTPQKIRLLPVGEKSSDVESSRGRVREILQKKPRL